MQFVFAPYTSIIRGRLRRWACGRLSVLQATEKKPLGKNHCGMACLVYAVAVVGFRPAEVEFYYAVSQGKNIVCNSDEEENRARAKIVIFYVNPHQVIEGIGDSSCDGGVRTYNDIRGEYYEPLNAANRASRSLQSRFIGNYILDSGFDFQLYNHLGAGAYICGKENCF